MEILKVFGRSLRGKDSVYTRDKNTDRELDYCSPKLLMASSYRLLVDKRDEQLFSTK